MSSSTLEVFIDNETTHPETTHPVTVLSGEKDYSPPSDECTKCWNDDAVETEKDYEDRLYEEYKEQHRDEERQKYLEGNYYKDLWYER